MAMFDLEPTILGRMCGRWQFIRSGPEPDSMDTFLEEQNHPWSIKKVFAMTAKGGTFLYEVKGDTFFETKVGTFTNKPLHSVKLDGVTATRMTIPAGYEIDMVATVVGEKFVQIDANVGNEEAGVYHEYWTEGLLLKHRLTLRHSTRTPKTFFEFTAQRDDHRGIKRRMSRLLR
ncbi:hypothetical protein M885DRAFT_517221 [Pelagophyceae sp. CCMP2097]|nr:hypothetical protein M885DRAFT_517221 [Pelagophyceae sp. CCMP2097]